MNKSSSLSRSRRFLSFLAGSVLLVVSVAVTPQAGAQEVPLALIDDQQFVPGEALVKFKEQKIDIEQVSGKASLNAFVSNKDLTKEDVFAPQNVALVSSNTGESTAALIDRLDNDSRVEYVEPNYVRKVFDTQRFPDDTYVGLQWALHNTGQTVPLPPSPDAVAGLSDVDMDLPEAWNTTTGSSNIIVAILDTGADITHPDLTANLWDGSGGCVDDAGVVIDGGCPNHGWDYVNSDNDPTDDHYHGTHVAGIVGARGNNGAGISGVSWNVSLMPIKVANAAGLLTSADWIKGLNFAKRNGATIVNASFGGESFSQSEVDALTAFNGLFVAAAGNGGGDNLGDDNDLLPTYPSSYDLPNVLAIAATDSSDIITSFSNYGATTVDVVAPGKNILSTYPQYLSGINPPYAYISGTSMATPYVAGLAALISGYYPNLTVAQIRGIIERTGDSIPALSGVVATGKRVNAANSISAFVPQLSLTSAVLGDDGVSGRGLVQVSFTVTDNVGGLPITLNTFEYSVDGGQTFVAPTNTDATQALSASWANNTYVTSVTGSGTPTTYTFSLDLNHADLAALTTPLQSDVRIRFLANNGVVNSSVATSADFTPPTSVLTGAPVDLVSATTASITVSGTDVVSYKYKVDSGAFSEFIDVATLVSLSGLSDGSHTLTVHGKDVQGNVQVAPTTATWSVDATAPVGTIALVTASPMNISTPTISLTAEDAGVGNTGMKMAFSCDDISYTDFIDFVVSYNTFDVESGLNGCNATDGDRQIFVKLRDSLENTSTSISTDSFTVHTAAVVATFTSNPSNGSSVNVTFVIGGSFVSGYKYRLDSSSVDDFSADRLVAQSISLSDLSPGSHTMDVIAKSVFDVYQSTDSPTTYTWTVATPVVVSSGGGGGGGGGGYYLPPATTTVATTSKNSQPTSLSDLKNDMIVKIKSRALYYVIINGQRKSISYSVYRKKYYKTSRAVTIPDALFKKVPVYRPAKK